MQEQRLLTIVIATFNRGRFLKRLLESIVPELRKHADAVEVLIVDDGSTDNTPEVIAKFVGGPLPIRSLRNPKNLGLDGNLRYSFLQATTEYVWLFGDDDVMLEGALDRLVSLLRRYRVSFVHVGAFDFRGEFAPQRKRFQHLGPTRLTDRVDMITTVHHLLTYITRGVINKQALMAAQPDSTFDQYMGSIINQMCFVFGAIKTDLPCLIVAESIIACQLNNSGGYASCTSFGPIFKQIINAEFPRDPWVWDVIGNELLESYFPGHLKVRLTQHRYDSEDCIKMLRPVFGKKLKFWIYCYPIGVLPRPLAIAAWFLVRGSLKVKRMLLSVWWYIKFTDRKIPLNNGELSIQRIRYSK